jgi:PAS domain S-box-containing protein
MDLKGTRILIVDDNLENLNALQHMLKKIGFHVQTAQDGESALKKTTSPNFDLVLLDIVMPHMDGYQVLEALRKKFSMIELPIIMLTAVSENCDIVKALSLGANDYVIKPYDFSVINSRIRTQISLKKTQEALKQSEERYTLAAQATQDGLWDWDLITNHIYYSSNWKAILGFSEKEIENTPDEWLKRVHPADKEPFEQNIEKLKKGTIKRFQTEQRLIHKNGSYRWVVATGIAVTDNNGTCVRLAGSMTDITSLIWIASSSSTRHWE